MVVLLTKPHVPLMAGGGGYGGFVNYVLWQQGELWLLC